MGLKRIVGNKKPLLKRLKSKLWTLTHSAADHLHSSELNIDTLVFGDEYEGWAIAEHKTSKDSIVYSFGIGEDISFDLGIIEQFGCYVFGFDPTPKSAAWISQQRLPQQFVFHRLGIGATDGEVKFYPSAKESGVSFSAEPTPGCDLPPVIAPVRRLSSILNFTGHSSIDILKMDIEGFEYEVIADLTQTHIRPGQILVEFHHGMYGIDNSRTIEAVGTLRALGYQIFNVSNSHREYGFLRE